MPSADFNTIVKELSSVIQPGGCVEIRALHPFRGGADSGYFNDPVAAANAICALDTPGISGVYYTINTVNPDCLARAYNRFIPARQGSGSAADSDITKRDTLLIDIDPIRASGISSTDEEHSIALAKAHTIADELSGLYGWPKATIVDSGNGAHVKFNLNADNSAKTTTVVQETLKVMRSLWSNARVDVDHSVFNLSRICRLPGTVARKGENMPQRPHRASRTISEGEPGSISVETLAGFLRFHAGLLAALRAAKGVQTVKRWWYPDDEALYRELNREARHKPELWVPMLYSARQSGDGYRIASADLGQDWEEDVAISPSYGIKHFGVADQGDYTDGKRTAVSFIAETLTDGDKREAALKLSGLLNLPATPFEARPLLSPPPGSPLANHGANAGIPADLLGVQPLPDYKKFMRKAGALTKKHFDPVPHLVKDMVTEGLTLLSADPKAGKSYFALQLSVAMAFGVPFLGKDVPQRGVFYMGLEEDEANFKERLLQLVDYMLLHNNVMITRSMRDEILDKYLVYYVVDLTDDSQPDQYIDMPTGERGLEVIRQMREENPHIDTVVVDTLNHFKPEVQGVSGLNAYEKTYREMQVIAKFQKREKINFIALHHNKKGSGVSVSDDFMQDGSGSQGLPAAVDTFLSLKGPRPVNGLPRPMTLSIGGRRMFDSSMNIQLVRGAGWIVSTIKEYDPGGAEEPGDANEVRTAIHHALSTSRAPMSVTELMRAIGIYSVNPRERDRNKSKTKYALEIMVDRGQIQHIGNKYGFMEDWIRQGGGTKVPGAEFGQLI